MLSSPVCTTVFVLSLHVLYPVIITSLRTIQSGSELSLNQEAADPSLVASPQIVQVVPDPHINPSVEALISSSYTTPLCTPLPLELHIDEDGCSAATTSVGSALVAVSSKYSQIQQKGDGGGVTSDFSHVEHYTIPCTQKPSCPPDINSCTQMSVTKVSANKVSSLPGKTLTPVNIGRGASPGPTTQSPIVVSKSPSPGTVSMNRSPIIRAKSPSPPDLKTSRPVPVSISHASEAASNYESPMTVPKAASPVTVPRLSSPVPKSASPLTVPNISSPVNIPKCSSPVSVPRLSSPLPKISSPVTVPYVSCLSTVPRSPSPILKETTLPKSPVSVIRKAYTIPGASSPRASPVSCAAAPSEGLSPPPTEKLEADVLDLTWPCREPLLDDALVKLLTHDSTQPTDNQPIASDMPGDEDRFSEEEDGIYPDLCREETLTPMTESSWIDECFTPSTCPGTPDATLDLPTQQPSAVERLSASGQVGGST